MTDFTQSPLTPLETRVLGVLVEKQYTTPDVYPLTVNSLVSGCNQKTSRHPVMNVTEKDVATTLEGLKYRSLVVETYGASGRVLRYSHNMAKVLGIGQPMLAILAALMLRGPLTPGELRTNCDRMYHFADISSVEAYLEDMITRAAVPLVVKLARQPGSREHRWAQLLSGAVAADAEIESSEPRRASTADIEMALLAERVDGLEREMAELRERLARLETALGA